MTGHEGQRRAITAPTVPEARAAALALSAGRADGATVCPSEVASVIAARAGEPSEWRAAMPVVHDAVDRMLTEGLVRLSWKGRFLDTRSGAYRLRLANRGKPDRIQGPRNEPSRLRSVTGAPGSRHVQPPFHNSPSRS